MAISISGRQFDSKGKTLRTVNITFARGYDADTVSYNGDTYLHIDIGSRTVSVAIKQEDWQEVLRKTQMPQVDPNATWQHKE